MKKIKFISLSLFFFGTAAFAQDLDQAKKAIDAEQYQKAKTILKSLIASSPDKGKNYFHLGEVYLALDNADSAKIYFDKGIVAKDNGNFNYIGLGEISLDKGNAAEADANFNKATANLKKKDAEEFLYIGKAYINSENHDYKKAITSLKKAIAVDPKYAQAFLSLGDAQFGDADVNSAYSSYRTAYDLDNSLVRAKMQLGVITKNAKAFPEAITAFNEVIKLNANYGPVYRELAETYYFWSTSDTSKREEYIKKALEYYEKYMSLTDYSLDSRMRHADFLILAKDYQALQKEAQAMQQLDKVNPRIYRYLGYAAYENKNYDESIKALNDFIAKADPKRVSGRDYLFLAKAKLGKAITAEGTIADKAKFDSAMVDLAKATEIDPAIGAEFSDLGVSLYKQKLYLESVKVFEPATKAPNSKNALLDNFYLGNAVLFYVANDLKTDAERNKPEVQELLKKADTAYGNVVAGSPTTQDAHLNRAKINRFIVGQEAKDSAVAHYQKYIEVVHAKGEAELAKESVKAGLIGAYSYIGSHYAISDKAKAKEYFEKALVLDPNSQYIKESLDVLKK
ncbi:tetratricopeptide repeat protein [Flavobacterium sp. WW92]|uniref:tetratricopeptide repeat protein n=1 Tax=unclassified Flavobacterium TaxID=196869 RepID=UPI00222488EC|nr:MULTISPECIES: tetratricopeptide repeat protein [unclassified Flavobacterium]WDO14287.1 tetratricopeptide repeat protein [Flavobacterium sp. WW92]